MIGWLKKIGSFFVRFGKREETIQKNVAYNGDRVGASEFGAPPQETISSELGRHAATNPIAGAACKVLDAIDPDHCADAVAHADRLDAADNGTEK